MGGKILPQFCRNLPHFSDVASTARRFRYSGWTTPRSRSRSSRADAELEAELAAPAASQSKKRTADEAALGTQWYDVAAASSSDPAPVGAHAALAAAAAIADAAVGGSAMP